MYIIELNKGGVMSQKTRLLNWLIEYGEIDPLTAWQQLGIYRLGARIHDLKRDGYRIETDKLKIKNRWNESCTVANYKINLGAI